MLQALIEHARWADAESLAAIRALADGDARTQSTRIYAHLAAAAHVWWSRLEGRQPVHPVWPALSLDEAHTLANASFDGLADWAGRGTETLRTTVEYRTTGGQAFRNTVADVITQVVLHAGYHRGQLALLTRQGGGTPAMTDYIFRVRQQASPSPPA